VFLAIFAMGVIMTGWASNYFSPPVSEIVMGLGSISVAVLIVWWLIKVGPESNAGQNGSIAWISGALAVVIITFISGDQYIALGGVIGAGVVAIVEIGWAHHQSSSGR